MVTAARGDRLAVNALISLPLTGGGPGYTCERILAEMVDGATSTALYTPADRRPRVETGITVHAAVPRWARSLPFRSLSAISAPLAERMFAADCAADRDAAAFLWGDVSPRLIGWLRDSGTFIVREKYNCGKAVSKDIMARAYAGLDAMDAYPAHQYSAELIAAEHDSFGASDMIFCPSPMVAWSLREVGIAEEKLVATSYGFDPLRFQGDSRALSEIDGPTFVFAGYICVRKGAHILLEAWKQAGVRGRLVLVGQIEPLIAERYADVLARDDVEYHAFASDIGAFYRSADYFIFPTLEEGGPQVTYEAAYCHLPSIVSQMGAGAILRDGVEGHIVGSDAIADWAEALVAAERERGTEAYRTLATAARARAENFTWDRVGKQRREALLEKRDALLPR